MSFEHYLSQVHLCLSPLISIDMNKTTAVMLRLAEHSFNEDMQFGWTVSRCISNCKKRLLASSCLSACLSILPSVSVCLHGTTWLAMNGFSWDLIFEYYLKIRGAIQNFREFEYTMQTVSAMNLRR